MNLILTGPMGSGKTSVGELAARELGWEFCDTDAIVERRAGRTISEIFARRGEAHFRELEAEVARDLFVRDGLVVATGGGAVLSPENMRRLRVNGVVVNLHAEPGVLLKRISASAERPLLPAVGDVEGALGKLLAVRAGHYSVCDFRLDTGAIGIGKAAERVCEIARLPPVRLCASISGAEAESDLLAAARGGASMAELRFDLIPSPDVEKLVRGSFVPVIATDRKDKGLLARAIRAGCEFVDVEHDSPEKDDIIHLAGQVGCRVIVSLHDFDGVPEEMPEKGDADLVKIAAKVNSAEDAKRLMGLQSRMKDAIVIGMGPLGSPLRVMAPMMGSYLTYCSVGRKTAPGQLDLRTMRNIYAEMGLR